MTEISTAHAEFGPGHEGEVDHDTSHDLLYVKIAAILAVVTGAEVALPYLTEMRGPVIAVMLMMMSLKFFLVGAYFMHLKFESALFRRAFVFGIALAVIVYTATLTTFRFFA